MSYQVNTQHPMICRQLVDLAKKNGWTGSMFDSNRYPDVYLWLILDPSYKTLAGDNQKRSSHTMLSIADAIKMLETPLCTRMPFHIDSNNVDVYCDRVVVGCTTVSKDKLQQITNEMKKLEN